MTRRAVATMAAFVAVVALLELTAHTAHATAALVEHGDSCCGEPESASTCRFDRAQEGLEDLEELVGLDVHAAADELRSRTRVEVRVVPDELPDVDPVLVWRIGVVPLDSDGDYLVLNSGYEIVICAGTAVPDTTKSLLEEASRLLDERTLAPSWLPPAADDAWTVESSDPAAGTLVGLGANVTLTAVPPPVVDDPPPVVDPPPTPRVPTPTDAPADRPEPAPRRGSPETPQPPAPTQSPSATPGEPRVGPSESTTPLVNDDPVVPPGLGVAVGAALVAAWAVAGALVRARGRMGGEGEPGDPARSVSVRVVDGYQALDLLELPAVRPGRSLRIHLRSGRAAEGDRIRLHDPSENGGGSHD